MNPDSSKTSFVPDFAVLPGQTLLERLEIAGLSQADLAERTGRPKKTINEIIKGKAAITPETAIQLERVLGIPASFWNSREQQYREALARFEERSRLQGYKEWLDTFPIAELKKRDWLPPADDEADLASHLLRFFGVANPAAWNDIWNRRQTAVSFRKPAIQGNIGAIAAWLRQGEIEGRKIECKQFNAAGFKEVLARVRLRTRENFSKSCAAMIEECRAVGVAVVLVRELPNLRVSGATHWLAPDKALLQLSLLYKRDDQFWFSFFHEAAHILLHGKRELFIDNFDKSEEKEEIEANRFAADYLISPDQYKAFLQTGDLAEAAIESFAKRIGIAPGIVVGRLQHDKHLQFNQRNGLKIALAWK